MKFARPVIVASVLLLGACGVGEREVTPGPIVSTVKHDVSTMWSITIPELTFRHSERREVFDPIVEALNGSLVREAEDFKRGAREMLSCLEQPPEGGCDAFSPHPNPRLVRYLAANSVERGGLVVVRFTGYDDYLANHPAITSYSRAFDLSTGAEVRLSDVLSADDLRRISPVVSRAIVEKIGMTFTDEDWLAEGLADYDSYATWWPDRTGLHVVFADYAVAAHAAGTPEILVPWTAFDPADARRLGAGG